MLYQEKSIYTMEYIQQQKEGNLVIFNNMDGSLGHYASWNYSEKDKCPIISFICGILKKKQTNNTNKKQRPSNNWIHRFKEQRQGLKVDEMEGGRWFITSTYTISLGMSCTACNYSYVILRIWGFPMWTLKERCKWTYLQNESRVTDVENRLTVTRGKRGKE